MFSKKLPETQKQLEVCLIGSGNWGSAIAKIVGDNATKSSLFRTQVKMYVYEEMVNGQKLSDIINDSHENVKYLPGQKLPENIVAVPDLEETVYDADILIFAVPHQITYSICKTLQGQIKDTAVAISLIKGFHKEKGGEWCLISQLIEKRLKITCAVLMGSNITTDVTNVNFSEATVGCTSVKLGHIFTKLFQTDFLRVKVVPDVHAVEACGTLKNIVACAAGFADGLESSGNTKAAVIRIGFMEIIRFVDAFYPGCRLSTFFESCGISDLIATCYNGRNRKAGEVFVKTGKGIMDLEEDMVNGQKLQGPTLAAEVVGFLKKKNLQAKFPLFMAVHKICSGELEPDKLIEHLKRSSDLGMSLKS